jgi:hypothetical protein
MYDARAVRLVQRPSAICAPYFRTCSNGSGPFSSRFASVSPPRTSVARLPVYCHIDGIRRLCPSGRLPFRYAPERPTTGKVRVARNPPRC